ncbi:receptor-like protein 46 [Macadamia integrifolia]|uniref:receptor-like protein 46 n=1 Tax=Macadamia integrifolia TaxID=60698 RepID=UPI001C529888|nr:receptor-like protein 46 [Macadamia integrifolia]
MSLKDMKVNWVKFQQLVVNWKKSMRVLCSHTLNTDNYCLMDLSRNQLIGKIPDSISELKGLKSLNVSNNQLTGIIRTTLGELENAEELDLSHEKLFGEIPPSFAMLNEQQ